MSAARVNANFVIGGIDAEGIEEVSGALVAVERTDKDSFSPEEWEEILTKIDKGEIYCREMDVKIKVPLMPKLANQLSKGHVVESSWS